MKAREGTVCKGDSRRLCRGCVSLALCHFVRNQVSTVTCGKEMHSCACAVMKVTY